MKKLVVCIGPDTIGVVAENKSIVEMQLQSKARRSTTYRQDSCVIPWMGRRYCKAEFEEAHVFTLSEYFKAIEGHKTTSKRPTVKTL